MFQHRNLYRQRCLQHYVEAILPAKLKENFVTNALSKRKRSISNPLIAIKTCYNVCAPIIWFELEPGLSGNQSKSKFLGLLYQKSTLLHLY
jgi:hypothetical protein